MVQFADHSCKNTMYCLAHDFCNIYGEANCFDRKDILLSHATFCIPYSIHLANLDLIFCAFLFQLKSFHFNAEFWRENSNYHDNLTCFRDKCFPSFSFIDNEISSFIAHFNDGGHADFVDPLDVQFRLVLASFFPFTKSDLTIGATNL